MRALLAPDLRLGEAPDPDPRPSEAVVAVRATSLNRGEARRVASDPDGSVPGWDVAGVVAAQAADGSGPAAGTRVVGLVARGAWAERVAVPTADLAPLPDAVADEQAATLPVAGLTALFALEVYGNPLGRRVAVTGATGGVGRFAVQLATAAGAHVVAQARREEAADDLRALGAQEVVTALGRETGAELVVEGVGGGVLADALLALAPEGTIVQYAQTAPEATTFHSGDLYRRRAVVRGLQVFPYVRAHGGAGSSLARLAGLLAAGRLDGQVREVLPWDRAPEALGRLLDGGVDGKLVLRVG
jgi:NADPH:quinone reductase